MALAVSLTAAVARWRRAPDWAVAAAAAVVVVAVGALSFHGARDRAGAPGADRRLPRRAARARRRLPPGRSVRRARRADGVRLAAAARGGCSPWCSWRRRAPPPCSAWTRRSCCSRRSCSPPRRGCATSPRPHVYACSHLANSASLLLPVSNLTNLLAFAACGVSFTRFAALMALPWLVAIAVEWVVLSRVFADDLRQAPRPRRADAEPRPELPAFALGRDRAHAHRLRDQLDRRAWRRSGLPPPARWRSPSAGRPDSLKDLVGAAEPDVPGVRARARCGGDRRREPRAVAAWSTR